MDSSGPFAIGAGVLAAIVTAVGIAGARWRHAQIERLAPVIVALAAGVLVTASLAHMLPHALHESPRASLFVLGGFVGMVFLSRLGGGHVCEHEGEADARAGTLALVGIGLHSFLDGLTYAVAFDAGAVSGVTVAAGMVLHELPEGLISYTLLVRAGHRPGRAALIAWLVAGLTTPVGAVVAVPLLDVLEAGLRATLVAMAGGVLLYVGAAHLLPRAQHDTSHASFLVAFLAGVGLAIATALVH